MWKAPFFLIFSAILMNAASYLRIAFTGFVKVDENYPSGWEMATVVTVFLIALAIGGYGYYQTVLRKTGWDLDLAKTKSLAFTVAFISLFMLPMISNDIFSVLSYGDIAAKGMNPFIDGSYLQLSKFFDLVGTEWHEAPCVYGPVNLLLAMAAVYAAKGNLFMCIILYKLIILAFSLIFILFVCRYLAEFGESRDFNLTALIVLSPVFWLQGTGQAHNDIVAAALIAGAIYYMKGAKFVPAAAFITAAILAKMLSLIILAFYFLFLFWHHRNNIKRIAVLTFVSIVVIGVLSFDAYYPFWRGSETLTAPMKFIAEKKPSKSHIEILSEIYVFAKNSISTVTMNPDIDRKAAWKVITPIFQILSLLLSALLLLKLRKANKEYGDFLQTFAAISVIAATFFSPVFQPWYLLMALPLFVEMKNKDWVVWVAVFTVWCNAENVMHLIDRGSTLYFILPPFFVITTVFLFFWKFKNRFI